MNWREVITYSEPSAPSVSYLAANPDIRTLIEQAYPVLQDIFGESTKLRIECNRGDFVVNALWFGSVQDGLDKLERFDDEWWLDRLRNDILFSVMCVEPVSRPKSARELTDAEKDAILARATPGRLARDGDGARL